MTANARTLERPATTSSHARTHWRVPSSPADGADATAGRAAVEPSSRSTARTSAVSPDHAASSGEATDDQPLDYWEEVALSRLRLAQWALIATLIASVVIALILG